MLLRQADRSLRVGASRVAALKGLALRVTLPPEALRVDVDPTSVRQIIYTKPLLPRDLLTAIRALARVGSGP